MPGYLVWQTRKDRQTAVVVTHGRTFSAAEFRPTYLISLFSVALMIDSFDLHRAKAVPDDLATDADMPKEIANSFSISYEKFERCWKRSLNKADALRKGILPVKTDIQVS